MNVELVLAAQCHRIDCERCLFSVRRVASYTFDKLARVPGGLEIIGRSRCLQPGVLDSDNFARGRQNGVGFAERWPQNHVPLLDAIR